MIYRVFLACSLALVGGFGCWGGQFDSDGGLFSEPPPDAGMAGEPGTAVDGDTSGSTTNGKTTSGIGSSAGGESSTVDSTVTTSGGTDGGAGDGAGGEGPSGCAPPRDVPSDFVWADFLSTETTSCDGAQATCLNSPCAELEIKHSVELEEDTLRLRIQYDSVERQLIQLSFSCEEESVCYYEVQQPQSQVYYLQLLETESGYAATRFYRSDQDPDEAPSSLLLMQKSVLVEQPESCGWFSPPLADLWDEYVEWILSLEWEC